MMRRTGGPSGELDTMQTVQRTPGAEVERPYEKVVILPGQGDHDARKHAWADARFATDIMAEHALFFALLMPPELAADQRQEALDFNSKFSRLFDRIANAPPPQQADVRTFVNEVVREIKPFIDYKNRQHKAQVTGELRSLVWPKFFDHTRREAERWVMRLENIAAGESAFDRREVVTFWSGIMDEHARFVAHLLDPDEYDLIATATKTSKVFQDLQGGRGGAAKALATKPGTVVKSLVQNPEMDAVLSAAQTILDFKTEAARGIEANRIKSIIDPRLADHVRREALKFVDELKRTKEQ
jgi:DUF2935 family protein